MQAKIALLPGDGIGPEVIESAAEVLNVIAQRYGCLLYTSDAADE